MFPYDVYLLYMVYYMQISSFFLKNSNQLSRASHHYHIRSKFASFCFALMVSITDEKYNAVNIYLKYIYDEINVTKYNCFRENVYCCYIGLLYSNQSTIYPIMFIGTQIIIGNKLTISFFNKHFYMYTHVQDVKTHIEVI